MQACTKHYIGNKQEFKRNPSIADGVTIHSISSNIDDKIMHETYLWPFANAMKAGTTSSMCSYNRINGSYECQNSKTLNGLLKHELDFQGYVVSDWLATHSSVSSTEAGLDMNTPGGFGVTGGEETSFWGGNISAAVTNVTIHIDRLDDMIHRITTHYYHMGLNFGFPAIYESTVPLRLFSRAAWKSNYSMGVVVDVRAEQSKLV